MNDVYTTAPKASPVPLPVLPPCPPDSSMLGHLLASIKVDEIREGNRNLAALRTAR